MCGGKYIFKIIQEILEQKELNTSDWVLFAIAHFSGVVNCMYSHARPFGLKLHPPSPVLLGKILFLKSKYKCTYFHNLKRTHVTSI